MDVENKLPPPTATSFSVFEDFCYTSSWSFLIPQESKLNRTFAEHFLSSYHSHCSLLSSLVEDGGHQIFSKLHLHQELASLLVSTKSSGLSVPPVVGISWTVST